MEAGYTYRSVAIRIICLAIVSLITSSALGAGTPTNLSPNSVRLYIAEQIAIQKELDKRRTPADVDSAIAIMKAALELAESTFGQNDTMVAHCLTQLGHCYFWSDHRRSSIPLVKRAIETWKQVGGVDHPNVGRCYRMLGDYNLSLGNSAESEAAYRSGIAIYENVNPTDSKGLVQFSFLYTNLAQVRMGVGQYTDAESLLVRGQELRAQALGADAPSVKKIDGLWARLYRSMRRFDKAEVFYRRAIENAKETNGTDNHRYAGMLSALAFNQFLQDKFDEAAEINEEAVEVIISSSGKYHSKAAPILALQAKIEAQKGNLPLAIEMAQDALDGRVRSSYRYSARVFYDQTRLARILVVADSSEAALKVYADMQRRKYEYYSVLFRYASDKQKLEYSRNATPIEGSLLSVALEQKVAAAIPQAFEMVLNGKSLVVDAIAAERKKAYCSEDSVFVALLDSYSKICTQISNVFIGNQTGIDEMPLDQMVDLLFTQKDQMERELSRLCSIYADDSGLQPVTLEELRSSLPDSSLLCEFVRYRPFDFAQFSSNKNRRGPPTYVAFSLSKSDGLKITTIGESREINLRTLKLQSLMADAPREYYSGREQESYDSIMEVCRSLYGQVVAPVLAKHSKCRSLIVAPDGLLNLLSFGMLADSNGTFLWKRWQSAWLLPVEI